MASASLSRRRNKGDCRRDTCVTACREPQQSCAEPREVKLHAPPTPFAQTRRRTPICAHLCRILAPLKNLIKNFFFIFLMLGFFFWMSMTAKVPDGELAERADLIGRQGYNPCCAEPCEHGGLCDARGRTFYCDCTNTGYSGRTCRRPSFPKWIEDTFLPSFSDSSHEPWRKPLMWKVINKIGVLHRMAMKYVYMSRCFLITQPSPLNAVQSYTTFETFYNRNIYSRHLPPVPTNCPTEMGIHGPKELPSVQVVFERVFRRRHFRPCARGTNFYFFSYAQYFIHQFFKTDTQKTPGWTSGVNEGVDGSPLYGMDEDTQHALRTHKNGKLKTIVIDGEEFPPPLSADTDVFMSYPKGLTMDEKLEQGPFMRADDDSVSPKWALGHPVFGMTPFIYAVATLWVREHNRICDILREEHPDWEDARLFHTTRNYIVGLMTKITFTGYVQHLSHYYVRLAFQPEYIFDTMVQFENRIEQEFLYLYHWHQLVPEVFRIDGEMYVTEDLLFKNNSIIFRHGFNRFLASMFLNIGGKMATRNHSPMVKWVGEKVMERARCLRLQSFNNYRRSFNLKPYDSFMDLTQDPLVAKDLEEIYGHVDAVEFFVGLFAERRVRATTPPTMVSLGGAWAIRGLLTNPLNSKAMWKPSTFGGKRVYDILDSSTLKDFVCRNLRGVGCSKMHVAYNVPISFMKTAIQHEMEMMQGSPEELRPDNIH